MGPFADNVYQLYGDYNSDIDLTKKFAKTPKVGLSGLAQDQEFTTGCADPHCTTYNSASVKEAVSGADVVVVCLGLGEYKQLREWFEIILYLELTKIHRLNKQICQ